MYVCVCHGVREGEILEAVCDGARSLTEVQGRLPVATCCGACEPAAHDCISRGLDALAATAEAQPPLEPLPCPA